MAFERQPLDVADQQPVQWVIELVRHRLGIDLSAKKTLVRQRLQALLWRRAIGSLAELCDLLSHEAGDGELLLDLVDRVTTHHTGFFRDAEQFAPILADARAVSDGAPFRVWSAACSTGEEPYSLAMTLAHELGSDRFERDVAILATDISQRAIGHAERGVYAEQQLEQIPERLRAKYTVTRSDGTFAVADVLKRRCLFRRLNLHVAAYPFREPFDWIICRNVFIYFPEDARQSIARKLAAVSRVNTGLTLGLTEAAATSSPYWERAGSHVYRRRR